MSYQFQCKSCPQNYIEVTEFIKHLKIHMMESEIAKKPNLQNMHDNEASFLQRSIEIKLENKM